MRPYSARAVQTILLAGVLLLALFHAPVPPPARAGEAIRVGGPGFGVPGAYITWNPANFPISYTVDGGNLGNIPNATAVANMADAMFAAWAAVPTTSLTFTNAGAISAANSAGCVNDGDVDTIGEFNCLSAASFPGNPIIFDVNGTLIDAILGAGASNGTLGFAGPLTSGIAGSAFHVGGRAVLNGKFVDGIGPIAGNPETTPENMQATALHEFGHFLGLGHSQINNHCFALGTCANGSDDAFGIPTMYPVSFGLAESAVSPGTTPPELTLALDDIAWISLLYPAGNFLTTHGFISGQLLASDGLSAIQGGNIIARMADDPATAGVNESLQCAVSIVSGETFNLFPGQSVTGDNPGPAGFPGTTAPSAYGSYVIPVPVTPMGGPAVCAAAATAGTYTLQVESINTTNFAFVGGSGVGPHGNQLQVIVPIPGPAEFFTSPETDTDAVPGTPATFAVAAGGTTSNINIILNGTQPSNDSFEGAGFNDSVATAAPIGNGTRTATISPFRMTGPDNDFYSFTAIAGQTVTFDVNASTLYSTILDSVMEIVDGTGTRVNLCRATPGSGSFNQPCLNDDTTPGVVLDSILEFQSPTAGVFYVHLLDWRGDARVDFRYDLVVSGAGAALSAPGCTKDFDNGGGNNDWNTANNWNPDGVPGASDDVCIDGISVNHASGATTIDSIAGLTGTLTITAGSITATTSVLINGGTLALGGGSLTTGTVNLTSGVLQGNGSLTGNIIQDGGTLGAGFSPGLINLTGDFTQNAGGLVIFEIFGTGGAGNPTGHDQINITGNAAANGTVNVVLDPGYTPTLGDTFTLATFATDVGGGGGTVNFPDISGFGFQFVDIGGATDFTIQVQALAGACTINFDNSNANGLWQDAQNWDTNTLPVSTDDVCIGPGFTVTKSGAGGDSINSLTVDNAAGLFTVSGGTLTIAAASTIGNSGFALTGGVLDGAGDLTIGGVFTWAGGNMQGTGVTTANGGMNLTGGAKTLNNGRTLNNAGMATWADGEFFIGNGAVFNNQATGIFDIQHTGTRNLGGGVGGASTVNNAGTMTKSAGAGLTVVNAGFNNTGTFNANDGTFRLISAANPSTSTGAFNVGAGTLEFNNGTYDLNSPATVSGAGTITIPSGNVNFNNGSSLTTAVSQSGGVLTLATGGTVTLPTLTQSGGRVTGTGTLDITGAFAWSGGDHTGTGTTNANGGMTLSTGNTKTLNTGRTLNNPGMATWTDGEFFIGNGAVFQNQATGTFDIQHTGTRNLGGGVGGGSTVNNAGTMTKSAGGGLTVVNAGFNNTGTLNANDGTFRLISAANPSASTGAFNVGVGTLEFNNGTYDLNSGATVTGAGTTTIPSGTVNFNNGSSLTTAVSMSGGLLTLTTGGSVTLPTLTQSGGTVAGTDLLNITGAFTWSGGVQQGAGGVTNANGGMTLNGVGVTLNNGRTLNNTAVATWASGEFFIGNGAILNNQATGTFNIQHGANLNLGGGVGGVSTATNAGTMTQSAGGSITTVNAGFANTGTLNVNAGTMNFSASFTQTGGASLTRLNGGNLGGGITFAFNGGVLDAVGGSTITGNVNNAGATMRPGMSPGLLNIVGNYIQGATGVLDIELGGTTPGTQFDVVAITGSATLAGTLNVQPFMGFNPSGNFQIMTFASRIGDFATTNNTTANPALTNMPGTNDYVLSFAAAPCGVNFDNGAGTGLWQDATNWDNDTLPAAGDNVCIGVSPVGPFTVTKSANGAGDSVNSLTVADGQGIFTLGTATNLTIAAASTIGTGGFALAGGTLDGTGSFTVTGPFNWSSGTHSGAATTNANGGLNMSGGLGKIIAQRTFNNNGAAVNSGAGNFTLNNATFNNVGSFDQQTDSNISEVGTGIFNNSGTFTKSGAGGNTTIAPDFNNTGTVNANSGTLQLGGSATHTGTFNVAATLDFAGGTHDLNTGTVFTGVGTILVDANWNVNDTVAVAPAVNHTSGTIAGAGTLNLNGLYTWSNGTQGGAGITNSNGGVTFTGGLGKTISQRTFNSNSAAVVSGAGTISLASGGTFNNVGTFDLQVDTNIGLSVAGMFNNPGVFTKSGAGGTSQISPPFNQSGTLNVNSGTLSFFGSFTQTAGLTSLNGGSITTSTQFDFNGGTLSTAGGSTITGNVANTGAVVNPGTSPGTLNIAGNYTQGAGGTLNIELGGVTPGTQFDVLAIGGSATLGGTLNVLSFGGFTPVAGDSFNVMTYTSFTGDFATKNGLNISTPALTATPQATFYLLSVPAQADLAVTKTDAADPVVVGENISYTVTVTNNGPSTANNVVLTDTLPAGVAFVSATAPCAEAGGTVTCNLGTLGNGAMTVITIVVTPSAPGMLSNTASVTTTDVDPNLADNSDTETTTVNQAATTTAVTSSVNPSVFGENVTFTATVTVNAPGAGTPTGTVDFFDGAAMIGSGTLGAGGMATFATSALSVGAHNITATYNGNTNFTTSTSAPLVQNVTQAATTTAVTSSVNPSVFGENVTFTATVTPVAPGAGTPSGTVDFFDGAVMIGSGTLNAGGMATFATSALSVGAHNITATYSGDTNFTGSTSAPQVQNVNQASTSTALVSSLNPSNTGDNVTFTATVTPVAPGAGTPSGTVDFFDGAVMIGSGTLNAGGMATFATSALSVGTHPITAVYNGDTNFTGSTSNIVSQAVNGVADLSVTKSDVGSDPVNVGQNIVYTVTVANAGPDPANNVVLTDTLPAGVTFVSAVPSQGGPCTLMGMTVTCPLGTINNGANATVMITVTTGALAAPSVTNSASVTTTEIDPNAANDTVSEMTTVNPVADLALTKGDSPDPVVISNNITYTLTVSNNGPSPATVVVIDDPLPANVTFVSVTAPAGSTCTTPAVGATGTVNCTLPGMLASGANAVVTIVVQAPAAAGTVNNTATVTSAITDPTPANNTATADTTVSTIIPSTDFSLSAVPINNNVIVGQSGTYTVTVGPLPAGTSFTNPISLACMSPTGTCTIAPNMLTPGANPASATMTVETAALLGSAPPVAPRSPEPGPPVSPVFALWTFLAGLMLVSLGYVGKKTQRRSLAHCLTFGLVLLVIAGAVGQSACGTRVRRQVSGPYTVTVTATSGALSHTTTVTLNVTQP